MGQQAGDPGDPIPELGTSPRDVRKAQKNDPTLSGAYDSLAVANGHVLDALKHSQFPHFMLRDELLYRVCKHPNTGDLCEQILVPKGYRRQLLQLSHSIPLAGHLGREKTLAHLLYRFFWPGVYKEVENFCKSCPECQLVAPKGQVKAPLIPIPLVELPFERIGVDLVGPLEKTAAGNHHILVIADYATRYPEAIPLRNTSASTIANEFIKLFSRVGIPKEILTDQGTNFTSKLMKEVCALLNIKSLKTSVYHPQTDGLVERFNGTLKKMLRKFVDGENRDWDKLLPYLLFAIREVPQSSTGFSPFELLYGRRPRGILDIVKEEWEAQSNSDQNILQYTMQLRERLKRVGQFAASNLETAQQAQALSYNRNAKAQE
uniref:Gypsy retrotransposon integrase-like protein 1 n=1 Tax=Leptobrachium leishanense TaxID=445787 RepID=A0A8C5Q8W6_9ANUR